MLECWWCNVSVLMQFSGVDAMFGCWCKVQVLMQCLGADGMFQCAPFRFLKCHFFYKGARSKYKRYICNSDFWNFCPFCQAQPKLKLRWLYFQLSLPPTQPPTHPDKFRFGIGQHNSQKQSCLPIWVRPINTFGSILRPISRAGTIYHFQRYLPFSVFKMISSQI